MLGDHEVTIVGETGDRVMLVRDSVIERNIINSTIGTWPEDQPSQRAWALSVVVQKIFPIVRAEDGLEEAFAAAQQIVDWVQDGRVA